MSHHLLAFISQGRTETRAMYSNNSQPVIRILIQQLFNKMFILASSCLQFQTRKYPGLPANLRCMYCANCTQFSTCTEENFPVSCGNHKLFFVNEDTFTTSALKQLLFAGEVLVSKKDCGVFFPLNPPHRLPKVATV